MDSINNKNIMNLGIDELQPNPLQPRGVITSESVTELVSSIKEHGILEPLVVAHTPAGYQIIVGERRWRASRIAGLKTVPCLVKETSPKGMLEMALVENVQREDLNPIEKAKAFHRLAEEFSISKSDIARRIGKSAPYISNTLKLLELPDALKDGLLSGLITEGHARALQGIHDQRLMIEAYKLVLSESASVRRAEEISRRIRAAAGMPTVPTRGKNKPQSSQYYVDEISDRMEDELRDTLGPRVKVKIKRSSVQSRLNFIFLGSMEETEKQLTTIYQAITGNNPNLEKGQ